MLLRARSALQGHVRSQYLVKHATGVEVFSHSEEISLLVRRLRALHQVREVERSGESRPGEIASGAPSTEAGAQPLPHNPRK
jgi:hypothetical protein